MLTTELTKVLGIEHPVIQAGMGQLAGGPLVSAVSNAGGLGVVGGVLYTPEQLRAILSDVKVSSLQPLDASGGASILTSSHRHGSRLLPRHLALTC